jgi:restriction endonuclease Mrr
MKKRPHNERNLVRLDEMNTERSGIRDTREKGKKDMTDLSICKYREASNKIQLHCHHGLITKAVSTTSTTWTEGDAANPRI